MANRHEKMSGAARNLVQAATGLGCLVVMLIASGCGETPKDTRVADEATIRAVDAQWAKSVTAKDLDATVAYYSDGASLLAPNEPIASDKQSVRAAWAAILVPGTTLSWQASKVDVARSGDMAYIVGPYQMTTTDLQGRSVPDRGKFVEVWKKQADGNWKVVADIFNSDLALLTPVPAAKKKTGHPHTSSKKKSHHSHSNAT